MSVSNQHRRQAWIDRAIVVLSCLAPALGGATDPAIQAFLLIAGLGLLQFDEAAFHCRNVSAVWFILPWLASCLAFLPNGIGSDSIPHLLANDAAWPLPATISPQPWITLEHVLLLGANLFWAFYLLNRQWTLNRQTLLELFATLIAALALLALAAKLAPFQPPTWHPVGGFGFFPNRNQTGNLLGITAVILFILISVAPDARTLFKWLGLGLIVASALVMNHSRAGLGIAFAGCLIWIAAMLATGLINQDQALKGGSLLVVATLVLFGFRLQLGQRITELASFNLSNDFRVLIQKDTLKLISHYPVTGLGLGNFAAAFGLFQEASLNQKLVLHPESDWLWLAAETGWFGVVAFWALILKTLRNVTQATTDKVFRWGIFILATLFCLHGFLDVSGHRMGAVWPILLLVAIAQESQPAGFPLPMTRSIQITGVLLAGLIGVWGIGWIPGAPRLNSLANRVATGFTRGQMAELPPLLDEALAIAPLDWRWHFYSGLISSNSPAAQSAFARANRLEPGSPELPLQEFRYWRPRHPGQAWFALNECLQRGGFSTAYVDELTVTLRDDEPALEALWKLNRRLPDNQLLLLSKASNKSWPVYLEDLLANNPALAGWNRNQRQELFRLWEQSQTSDRLAPYCQAHEDQLSLAWPALARWHIRVGHFDEALKLIQAWQKTPAFLDGQSLGNSQALPSSQPDVVGGLRQDLLDWKHLSTTQDHTAALAVAQKLIQKYPRLPLLHFLSYRSATALGQTETACNEWRLCADAANPP